MISAEEFAKEYEEHRGSTRKMLSKLRVSNSVIDDYVQDAWATAWEHRGQFAGRCKFHVWVSTIARNCFWSDLRSKARHEVFQLLDSYDKRTVENEGHNRVLLEQVEHLIRCNCNGADLYIKYLNLHLLEGHSQETIAKRLKQSYGGFKCFLFRIKPVIREVINSKP